MSVPHECRTPRRMWLARARLVAVIVVVTAFSGTAGPPAPTLANAERPALTNQATNKWPTTEFRIVFRNKPAQDNSELLNPGPGTNQEINWESRLKRAFKDVAEILQAAGFPAPQLRRADTGAYEVHAVRSMGARGVYLWQPETLNININHQVFAASGEEGAVDLFKTAAHELFHAIMQSYAADGRYGFISGGNSHAQGSVDEGLCDGVARWVMQQHQLYRNYAERMPATTDPVHRLKHTGVYPYHDGFLISANATKPNQETMAYFTSSFWFNLLERRGAPVVQHLLSQKIPSSATPEDLVMWLDKGLKSYAQPEALKLAYNHFLTEMASYGEVRRYPGGTRENWFNTIFGNDCAVTVTLEPGAQSGQLPLDLLPMGGSCVRIAWRGFLQAAFRDKILEIQVRHTSNDRQILDQINMGLGTVDDVPSLAQGPGHLGTCWKAREKAGQTCTNEKLTQPAARGGRGPKTSARLWQYDNRYVENEQGEALFVVTNVALDAATTQPANGLTLHFAMNTSQSHTGPARSPSRAEPLRLGMPTGEDYMRLRMYGVNPDPPLEQTIGANPLETTLVPIAIPKGVGKLMDVGYYVVIPDPGRPIPYGSTGPLYGGVIDFSVGQKLIGRHGDGTAGATILQASARAAPAPAATAQLGRLLGRLKDQAGGRSGSMICKSNEGRPIGRVLAYNEDLLQVRIDTDICATSLRGVSLVERLDVTATLPFGWRYQHPAPTEEITPALEYFVDRFHDRLEGRLGKLWFGAPTDLEAALAAGPPPSPAGSGGAATGTLAPRPCDCSCEGYKAFEELSKRRDAAAEAEMKAMMPCIRKCMPGWTSCAR